MTATSSLNFSKTFYFLTFLIAIFLIIRPVSAEDATSPGTTRKDLVKQKIEARKDSIEKRVVAVKDKIASREAVLKAKLLVFKDKRKAEITERINTNLNKINQNQTTQMQKHLERMSVLLDKLENRVNTGSSDIKDPQAAKVAISSARASVDQATSAVKTQAGKDYTLQVTKESKVKADAQAMRTKLNTDLKSVRQLVITTKQMISNAIKTARTGQIVKEGTPSGK